METKYRCRKCGTRLVTPDPGRFYFGEVFGCPKKDCEVHGKFDEPIMITRKTVINWKCNKYFKKKKRR